MTPISPKYAIRPRQPWKEEPEWRILLLMVPRPGAWLRDFDGKELRFTQRYWAFDYLLREGLIQSEEDIQQ